MGDGAEPSDGQPGPSDAADLPSSSSDAALSVEYFTAARQKIRAQSDRRRSIAASNQVPGVMTALVFSITPLRVEGL